MHEERATEEGRLPTWSKSIFEAFVQQYRRQSELLNLSIAGITRLVGVPGMLNKLKAAIPGGYPDGEDGKARDRALEEQASLARREVDEDFPQLRAQAVIALWGSMEYLIRTLVASGLENMPNPPGAELLGRIKIRFGDWARLTSNERYLHLLDRVEQENGSGLRYGAAKFDIFLNLIGANISFDDSVRRALIELHQTRNLLVHREGLADRRFVEACSWLGKHEGEVVRVSGADYAKYFTAVGEYVHALIVNSREIPSE